VRTGASTSDGSTTVTKSAEITGKVVVNSPSPVSTRAGTSHWRFVMSHTATSPGAGPGDVEHCGGDVANARARQRVGAPRR
jgi:hypothetical protein